MPEELLRPEEAAQMINASPATLAIWRFRKIVLPFVVISGLIRYKKSDLESHIAAHTITPGQPTPPGIKRRKGGTGRPGGKAKRARRSA
jgi:hypothetical protein